nr:MAG: ORF3 [Giant panda anellovirus]USZ80595.1 ORF3 [Tick-associated anellovirus 4]
MYRNGSGVEPAQTLKPPSTPANSPQPVTNLTTYVLGTLPPKAHTCSIPGTSQKTGSSLQTSYNTSLEDFLKLLQSPEKKRRRHPRKSTARHPPKAAANPRAAIGRPTRRRPPIRTTYSLAEFTESEDSERSSGEEYSDY